MYTVKDNPIGIYEKAIPNRFDWADKIRIAKAAGFDFIEMSIDESEMRLNRLYWSKESRAYLRNLLFQEDFYINSMCLSGHRKYPFGSKDPDIRKKAYDIIDRAISLAYDLDIRNIQLAGYDVYYEDADDETRALFIEGLQYAVKKASAANVMLSIEIMDTEFMGTISKCMEFIRLIDSPWLQIYPDFGNLSQWTKTPDRELELGINHIVGIHLKDTKPGIFKCVPFGEGTVDFAKLFHKINDLGFRGPFLIEMWADNTVDASLEDCVEYIKGAKQWLHQESGGILYGT